MACTTRRLLPQASPPRCGSSRSAAASGAPRPRARCSSGRRNPPAPSSSWCSRRIWSGCCTSTITAASATRTWCAVPRRLICRVRFSPRELRHHAEASPRLRRLRPLADPDARSLRFPGIDDRHSRGDKGGGIPCCDGESMQGRDRGDLSVGYRDDLTGGSRTADQGCIGSRGLLVEGQNARFKQTLYQLAERCGEAFFALAPREDLNTHQQLCEARRRQIQGFGYLLI